MGNEASLEGGEGLLSGLPEGLAPDGKGGFVRVPGGTPVDLSELSEEQRKQLEVAMARAQGKQPGGTARRPSQGDVQQRSPQAGASRGSAGLSKSRTVDAFNQGPVRKPSPGRSPSSLSLFESKFRQEPKSSESKSSGMFGSSFLSGANPLSAMTSSVSSSLSSMGDAVNIPKFGIFGDEEEGDAATANSSPAKGPQQQGPKGPQQGGPQKPSPGPQGQGPKPGSGPAGQGPKPGQGPPGQGPKPGQGPPGQGPKPGQGPPGQGPKPGQGPPGQGPKPGQGPPGQGPKPGQGPPMQGPKQGQAPPGQGPKPGQGPQGSGNKQGAPPQQKGTPPPQGPGQKQQGPPGAGGQPGATKSAGPPAQQGAGKPIPCPLCKTTQMNVGSKDPPNFNNCTECKSQVCSLCGFSPPDSAGKEWLCLNCQMQRAMGGMDPPNPKQGSVPPSPQKQAPGKPGNLLIKQQSHQSDQGLTPPTTPRQKSPGATSPGPSSPSSSMTGSPKIDPKTGKPIMPKSSPQQSPAKPKQESSFFGGLGGISLGGLTDSVKPTATSSQSDSVTGKLFGGFGGLMETSKPQTQAASKQEESVAGKLFSGFGGMSDTSAKPPAAASQMFSFGSSLLSSATNLVTGEDTKPADAPQSPVDSGPGSPPDSPFSAPGSPPDTDSAPDTPPAKLTKPPKSISVEAEEKPAPQPPKQSCPLCNTDLNLGSSETPNYSLCTECKKTVCNLCGFNPTPHLGEKEWLCLNCQTQRAMSGQLGDAPPPAMASPKKQPPAPAAPTPAPVPPTTPSPPTSTDNKPVVEPANLNPAAPDTKVQTPESLQAPTEKEQVAKDGSLTCSSDLAKLESTVLPILEAQPQQEEQKSTDTPKTRRKLEVLPIAPDSPSSEEEREIPEQKVAEKKKLLVPMDVRGDSLEDSSESIGKESPASGEDEDFIRKQIIEMSENEDASPTDEELLIQQRNNKQENKREMSDKSVSAKARRLTKKATISPDDDEERHLQDAVSKPADYTKDSKQEEKGTPVRKFQTMELNAPSMRIATAEGEMEMECLTDSPDDRSKGEGSSSLHASSFTPGTSPTSVSSFEEDSDSSSPSNVSTGEGKQQRKAKHRQPGQLPTIEDSSEEEEMREEEELLREQEKQRGSGKKSKKDKEDKSQRRRERSKTPPSNLSPIEDASPTEELRQEAEMEEIRRSSCSDFSPSFDSDPEGFESHALKIAAVQKSYKLPVSAHSPTEEKTQKKPLKSADEAYEEIMLRAKSPTTEKVDNQTEKEPRYGGMLIEDYAYTSLIDKSTTELEESEKIVVPSQPKKLRSPDEVYEDMLQKRKEFQKLEEEYKKMQPKQEQQNPTPEIVLQPAENINQPMTAKDGDGKPLLDADTAYEELMKKVLTPGTSPTQQDPDMEITTPRRALHPIPDLKVTQCSSGELSSDDESFYKKEEEQQDTSEKPPVTEPSQDSPEISESTSTQAAVDLSALPRTSTPLMGSVTPLPTVPQYTPGVQSVVSTAPPIPPKPHIMRRGSSQDSADMPVAPPPTPPKPVVFPRKAPVPLPSQASTSPIKPEGPIAMTQGSPTRQPTVTPTYKAHVPPPVPPKPCIPSGMSEGPRVAHGIKPPIAPKPGSQPTSPAHVPHPPRPTMLPTSTGPTEIALNLSPTSEHKQFQTSPKSPPSPRYASNIRDTYVVITLPSQPSSPVDTISTQAPSSPGSVSPSRQALPPSYTQQQHQVYQPQQPSPQSSRVPLAYTRVTESIENQEICSPEKHVSSSCHIIEAISASAQPPVVTPNLISQVVTTEVQRTTVSVVHERPPPPVPAPRANGVPLDRSKPQAQVQTTQAVQPCEVVDLRTMKVDQQSNMNGVDLSAGLESRRQSYATDASRQNSAVQSPVVNLSAESSTVSIVTDSITIVTCAATIQRWDNAETTQASSVPLQLTKTKSFEPISQIIYRPVDSQPPVQTGPEIPINLSVGSGAGTYQSAPVTTVPPCLTSCAANGLTAGTATVAGAVDLSTTKPFNTVVSMDGASAEVVTAVITDDDGKPVDLTAGKRAVCCDVVYNLPFAKSCTGQQPATSLPEDRFGYRDDHYQYDRTPYGMRGFGGIKPSMSDTNLAEAGLFFYKSKNSYNFNGTTDGAVDLTSAKISDSGEAVDYSKKGAYAGMTIPPYSDARASSTVGTIFGTTNVLRSSNGIVYSSVGSPIPSTYAITTQPGSIFSTTYNHQSGMHTSDTMPSLSNLQNMPLTRSHSFLSTISTTDAEAPLNLELSRVGNVGADSITTASMSLDTYTDASLEAIAASLEALSSPMVAGDGQYQAERERLEMEKLKQQRLAEELERERQEIQRFREHEQVLVQKELEELQAMKQQILNQQEEERQAHLLMQKETYAQQQHQLEQIQRLQEQLRLQLEEQKLRQMYPGDIPGHGVQEAVVLGPDGTVLARKITDSGCQTDEEDETISKAYTAGRKKKNAKKSVDSCCQTDDEDQEEWEENRNRRPRTARGDRSAQSEGKASTPTGTQKKVKRTLPNPPSEEESTTTTAQTAYSTNSARRRMCRNSNMARAKILQDIDRELDMVERESSKLRKRQAELDEEEKEIDAKLRYLEMGINRRKDALLKEREKRERAYLQSVADERDYMSDSEVSHIRETRSVIGAVEDEELVVHGLERPRTAPQSELDEFGNPQDKNEFDKYSQYPYTQSQYQQSLYQTPQSYQSQSIYSSVPSLTSSQQQSYHQMLLLQQKAARQAALLSELDATKYDVINRQPDPTSSSYLGVKYDKYGNHLDLRALEVGGIGGTPMSAVSDSYYQDVDHHTPRSYMLLEDAAELAKGSTALSSSYSLAERELAKAEKLLRRSAADLGSTDYLGSTSRLHTYGKTPDEEEPMEEPYELKLLKQQLKQEFRRSTGGTENLEQHYYTPTTGLTSYSQRSYPKSEKYSISRLTLEKQAAKQLPASMLYQKHKTPLIDPKLSSKYSSIADRGLESEYTSYLGSSGSPRTSRLMQDEITFGLRKNIAEQQKYLGSNLGANLAGSLNLGQSLGLDSAYPSGSRSRPPSRPTSCYGLDLSIKRDPSSSSLRLKGDGESGDGSSYQTPSGRTKPTSLPIVQSGRGRIPIVAQNSEEESPLSPVGQPMGMARASAGPLPPISADSRDQFGSCLSLQDPQQQQQYIREEPTRGRGSVILDDLQGTMSDSEAYHLRREETDWFEKPRDGRPDAMDKKQGKGPYYPFPHLRVKLQRDPKDRTVSGNGLGIRVVGGKEVPNGNGNIGAYVAKVLPGGAAEQTGKILEGMQVLEWNGVLLSGKTYEEVQGLVGQPCNEAEVCVRLDLNMLAESETSQNLHFQEHSKSERPPRSPGVDPQQLAAELQKVSQQQAPSAVPLSTSATSSPAQPGSPSISKKRHSSKSAEGAKTHSHPISGEIQLQIHYDKQLGNLIVHVLQARNLSPRDNNGFSDPFVKVYLLPGRGQVMVVQNASAENKRRSKHAGKCINPEWNQTVIYKNIHLEQLKKKTLEVSVWDYDKCSSNDFLGEVLIDLSNTSQLDNVPRWLTLKEQSEGEHHRRSHSGQNRHSSKTSSQHSSPKTGSTHDIQDSPKSSVTKSRSHGVFPDPAKARSAYRSGETPVTAASLDSGLSGSVYSLLDEEAEANEVDSAIFQVPRIGKITNGTDAVKSSMGHNDGGGKSHVMGEIKIALKKEVKTEGDHLVLEILQCRNITYKFKSPDHLPDLYVKLYVVNIATQKRIIKKKTRVCRHDREPSFNETFRFCMNPTGHALQLFLVSNGGKFVKKTLIGEAYVWLDKVDLRKRVVSWHKLHASTAQIHS